MDKYQIKISSKATIRVKNYSENPINLLYL